MDVTLISDGGGLDLMGDAMWLALMLAPVIFAALFLRRRTDRKSMESSILRLSSLAP